MDDPLCGSVSGWYLKLVFPHDALVVDTACRMYIQCPIVHTRWHLCTFFFHKVLPRFCQPQVQRLCCFTLHLYKKSRPASVLFWPLVLNASFTSSLPRLVNVKICKLAAGWGGSYVLGIFSSWVQGGYFGQHCIVRAVTSDKKTFGASPSISLWTIHHIAIRPGFLRSWRLSWMIEWNRRRSQSSKQVPPSCVTYTSVTITRVTDTSVTTTSVTTTSVTTIVWLLSPPSCARPRALVVILLTALPCFTDNLKLTKAACR